MPIELLPYDILKTIFELVIPNSCRWAEPYPSLLVLSSVCHWWRTAALQNPLLWNALHFPLSEVAFQRTRCLLQRSASAPLDVYITINLKQRGVSTKAIIHWLLRFHRLITIHDHRWRRLEVDIPIEALNRTPVWYGQTPMLEKLEITTTDTLSSSTSLRPLPKILPAAQYLTSLKITIFPIRWDEWKCPCITDLSVGPFSRRTPGPNPTELCRVLSILSRRLRFLSISGYAYTATQYSIDHAPITLYALTDFHMTQWEALVQVVLLKCSFPVLEHINTMFPLENLASRLIARLEETPDLLQSVKRLSIGSSYSTHTAIKRLQMALPQASHIVLEDLQQFPSHFASQWECMTRLSLSEATLLDVKEFLSRRYQRYPTPLLELDLMRALGLLYRSDYDWISSRVDRFTIAEVRPGRDKFSKGTDRWPFEEGLLLPSIRTSQGRSVH